LSDSKKDEPQTVQLSVDNVLQLLAHYTERAQQAGSFDLNEASVLKASIDVVVNKAQIAELSFDNALDNLVKAVAKGQAHGGAYSLNDAANLVQILTCAQQNIETLRSNYTNSSSTTQAPTVPSKEGDLSELSEPVPLTSVIDV
jgi:hypothetical protein